MMMRRSRLRRMIQPTETSTSKEITHSSKINLFSFLLAEYGSVEFALDIVENFISFARRFKKDSRRYQGALNFLRYGIPATLLTSELIGKIQKYRLLKSGQLSVHNEKEHKMCQLLGERMTPDALYQQNFPIGKDIFNWLATEPPTKLFKILGYYDQNQLNKVANLSNNICQGLYVLIEYKGQRLIWDLSLAVFEDGIIIRESLLHGQRISGEFSNELKMCFFKEFVNHFNVKENVIYVHSSGIYSYPRKAIPENPIQFDVPSFEKEIDKVLSKGKKRAAVFVGVPGVGKSTVIKKLESSVTKYPIIYCTPDCFSSSWFIHETFLLIQYIQPCLVIMEDMDSYDFRDKKKDLGVFLDEMDDVNGKLKAFFIATINDTSLVHYSLINRPGRFDQVYLLDTPKTAKEIYEVMKTRYGKNKDKDPSITQDFLKYKDLGQDLVEHIVRSKFTHADICEIVEKALLIDYNVTMETLWQGYNALDASKKAIASCNFSGHDPRSLGMSYGGDAVQPTVQFGSTESDFNFKANGR